MPQPRKAKQRGRSRRCLRHRLPGGHDGRRPRHSLHGRLLHSRRSPARGAQRNARRRVTDAEIVTLCVAQAIMGIPCDRRFLAVARKRLGHLFPDAAPPGRLLQAPSPPRRRDRVADGPTSRSRARATAMSCCSSTRPRWSAAEVARPPSARRSARSLATATAPPTRAGSGACACTSWPRPTARRGHSRWPIRGAMSVRSQSSCWPLPRRRRACSSATRATPAASSPPAPPVSGPRGAPEAQGRAWTRSASGAHPPAHRIDLLDLQGPAHARAPWRSHHGGPA